MISPDFFLHENFLLQSNQSQALYHEYVKHLPLIDYHTHLSPEYIALNRKFRNLTEIWLHGDHYKWRAMRVAGVNERFVTGDSTDEEKFFKWAKVVPETVGNPLFHWTHLELYNPFGIKKYLNEQSANEIYAHCSELLQTEDFSTVSLLRHFNVKVVGTTDDPCDNLHFHQQIIKNAPGFLVTPTFRPDAYIQVNEPRQFIRNISQLQQTTNSEIYNLSSLLVALQQRIDYFDAHGCKLSDHGVKYIPADITYSKDLDDSFQKLLMHPEKSVIDGNHFTGYVLFELCKMYHAKGWVQQFHLGAIRNNNTRLQNLIGADCGCDSIGNYHHAEGLSVLLNSLDKKNQLAKTILYNLNPADNELFASMAGNFNDGVARGKIQYGAAWWFLDQKDGIENQVNTLANIGLVSTFIGMTTDSRSFLSYSRHEYFRRVLCNFFGNKMQKGELPNNLQWIGKMLQDISYFNAKEYFGFSEHSE